MITSTPECVLLANHTKYLLKNSIIYGSGELLSRLFGFILLPFYTRYFTATAYGQLQLLLISANLLAVVLQMGIGSALLKSVLHDATASHKLIFSTALAALLAASGLLLVPLSLKSELASSVILGLPDFDREVRLLALSIGLKSIGMLGLTRLRVRDKSIHFSMVNASRFALQLILTIYFVAFAQHGISGVIEAELITSAVMALVCTIILMPELGLRISLSELQGMLKFGMPLVPAAIAMFVLNGSDRYFLQHYTTMREVGIYSLGYRFGMVMALAVTAFQQAWGTGMYRLANEPNAKRLFARNFDYFLALLAFLLLGLALFSKEIIVLLATPQFAESEPIVVIVAGSYLLYGVYFYTSAGLNIKRKTQYQAYAAVSAAGLNLLLNWLLIPRSGMIGAATATLFSFAVMTVFTAASSQKFYHITYSIRNIVIIILTTIFILVAGMFLSSHSLAVLIGAKLLLILAFPVSLYFLGCLDRTQIQAFKNMAFRGRRTLT